MGGGGGGGGGLGGGGDPTLEKEEGFHRVSSKHAMG